MTRILLSGACGRMGRAIAGCVENNPALTVSCGVDKADALCAFPVFHNFSDVNIDADVIVDFSNPALLDSLLAYALEKKLPTVIATTGFTTEQIEKIHAASHTIPVFFTFNMSLGINLLRSLAQTAASVLGNDFDIEIVEMHHNQKLDAPSGTAIMLADSINKVFDDSMNYEYDRHSKRQKRTKHEIGIHSVRGGTIVGEHEIIFAGHDEVITLKHSAASREVFVSGALKAAAFIAGKKPGLYEMSDVIRG